MLNFNTKILESPIHGVGLFADEFIPKGSILWQSHPLTCQKWNPKEFLEEIENASYCGMIDLLDHSFKYRGCVFSIFDNARFINHDDKKPNAKLLDCKTEVTLRDIYPGQEILENYFEIYDRDDFFYSMDCMKKMNRTELLAFLRNKFYSKSHLPDSGTTYRDRKLNETN